MTALMWLALGALTLGLIWMTLEVLMHDPKTCRVCVERRASRERHPSFQAWLP
jgi:hypothetical protein